MPIVENDKTLKKNNSHTTEYYHPNVELLQTINLPPPDPTQLLQNTHDVSLPPIPPPLPSSLVENVNSSGQVPPPAPRLP